jgi:hypothetical protein
MGQREIRSRPEWMQKMRFMPWPGRKQGRYWKRQLSKSRRRYAKQMIRFGRGKEPTRYERECNYKTW